MNGVSGKSNKRGFTLTEALAVVAVLGIIAALAIPALVKNWRSVKLAKWDETAREIFLSAQNETSEIKAAGLLTELTQQESGGETHSTELQLLSSSETAKSNFPQTQTLLSTVGGSYVLEMNLLTGDIAAVYYSETEGLTGGQISAMEKRLEPSVSITSVKNDAERYTAGIGYYGGEGDSAGDGGAVDAIQPVCTVVNREDLYVKLAVSGLGTKAGLDSSLISASITVQGEPHPIGGVSAQASQTFTASGSESLSATNKNMIASTDAGGDYTLYLLLDSMTEGKSFAQLCPNLVPGDDLTLSLTLRCGGKTILHNRTFARVNSLFATKTAGGGAAAVTATYGYVRQLHNLAAYCNVSDTRRENASGTTIDLHQMQDIDFSALSNPQKIADGLVMPGNTAVDEYPSVAITGTPAGVILAGGGYTLENFPISGTSYAGLVGSCTSPLALKDLRVVDPQVSAKENAGVLAGYLSGKTTVSACRVYLTRQADNAATRDWMAHHTVRADKNAGGLIGNAAEQASLTFENSLSALPISAKENAGGFLGGFSEGSAAIVNSYASCGVTAEKGGAGGFVGAVSGGTLSVSPNCFTVSDVSAKSAAGALIGVISGGSAKAAGCAAYGTVSAAGVVSYGPMAGAGNAALTGCKGLFQSGNTSAANRYEAGVTAQEYEQLAVNNSGNTYPYLVSGTYPFVLLTYVQNGKTVTVPYYGDWPVKVAPAAMDAPCGLCYYEKYTDGSWGFYGYDKQGHLIDTLDYMDARAISGTYGYGVAAPSGTTGVTGPNRDERGWKEGWSPSFTLDSRIEISSLKVDLYPWANAGSDFQIDNPLGAIFDTFANRTVYLNPMLGAAVSLKDVPLGELESNPVLQIRTPGQLGNIGKTQSYSPQYYLRQTHNITANADTGLIDGSGHQFTYDGGNHTIAGLSRPLFGDLGNTTSVKNIVLLNVNINQSWGDTGPLAQIAQSSVTNCRVLSGTVKTTGGNAAGLIGLTYSSTIISDCFSANCTVTSETGTASGLIGIGQGKIQNCYVNNMHSISSRSGNAAGLIGLTYSSTIISDCFSANCTVTSETGTASGLIGNAQGKIQKCYANNAVSVTSPGATTCAAGFIARTEASVSGSFSCGTVKAGNSGVAVGFCNSENMSDSATVHCYSAARILGGGRQFGFKNADGAVADGCYWICQSGYNEGLPQDAGYGTAITLEQLRRLDTIAAGWAWDKKAADSGVDAENWTMKTTPAQTHPNSGALAGQAYPYPMILYGLDFYGDWPTP